MESVVSVVVATEGKEDGGGVVVSRFQADQARVLCGINWMRGG